MLSLAIKPNEFYRTTNLLAGLAERLNRNKKRTIDCRLGAMRGQSPGFYSSSGNCFLCMMTVKICVFTDGGFARLPREIYAVAVACTMPITLRDF